MRQFGAEFSVKVINTLAGERAAYISAMDVVAAPNADPAPTKRSTPISRTSTGSFTDPTTIRARCLVVLEKVRPQRRTRWWRCTDTVDYLGDSGQVSAGYAPPDPCSPYRALRPRHCRTDGPRDHQGRGHESRSSIDAQRQDFGLLYDRCGNFSFAVNPSLPTFRNPPTSAIHPSRQINTHLSNLSRTFR